MSDIVDELFPHPRSRTCKLQEFVKSQGDDIDEWVRQYINDWQDQLEVERQFIPQSDGISQEFNPRSGFRSLLLHKLGELLLPATGETYTKVVARCLSGDIANRGLPVMAIEATLDENEPEHVLQDSTVKTILRELDKCSA